MTTIKSIEEKARAYDEAFERAKGAHDSAKSDKENGVTDKITEYTILLTETIFSELKDSEDEQHHKWILEYLYDGLRKSDEQFKDQFKSAIAWFEKQGEQKPADKVKTNLLTVERAEKMSPFMKSGFENEPAAWSEEDEAKLKSILFHIGDVENKDVIDWLKSLKDRVRPQNGYNPYKEVVESIAEMCKHYDKASHSGLRDFYDNVKVKCKDAKEYDSLYPQNQWKPSDAQIVVLNDIIINGHLSNANERILKGLQEQLKKLREE